MTSIVDVKVALGLTDEARFLYHEATGVTAAEAKQAASLMAIYASATVHQVEIRDVNFPQVQILCHQLVNLRGRVAEIEKLCAELINDIYNGENKVMS